MKVNMNNYVCSICENRKVKLWRPYQKTEPLICAECAEKAQVDVEYDEKVWSKEIDKYVGTPTGRKLPLPKWNVNEKGKVPTYDGPGPKELPQIMTDQLFVDLSKISIFGSPGNTTLMPAFPNENGSFWGYTSAPEEIIKWWEELPTRQRF